MTPAPESQRVAIAETRGYSVKQADFEGLARWNLWGPGGIITIGAGHAVGLEAFLDYLPNWPADLNACHEMEKALTDEEWPAYLNALEEVADSTMLATWRECLRRVAHATAAQRCEAFLRVKGKWTGGDGE